MQEHVNTVNIKISSLNEKNWLGCSISSEYIRIYKCGNINFCGYNYMLVGKDWHIIYSISNGKQTNHIKKHVVLRSWVISIQILSTW